MSDKKHFLGFIAYSIKNFGQSNPNYEWKGYLADAFDTNDITEASSSQLKNLALKMYYAHMVSMSTNLYFFDILKSDNEAKELLEYLEAEEKLRKKFGWKLVDVVYHKKEEKVLEHLDQLQASIDILKTLMSSPTKKTTKRKSPTKPIKKKSAKSKEKSPVKSVKKTSVKTVKEKSIKIVEEKSKSTSTKKAQKTSLKTSPKSSPKKEIIEPIIVTNYTDKAGAIFGDFGDTYKSFKDKFLMKEIGIRASPKLAFGFGWVFGLSGDKLDKIEKAFEKYGIDYQKVTRTEMEKIYGSSLKELPKKKSPKAKKSSPNVKKVNKNSASRTCKEYTVKELQELAKEKEIKGRSKMKKDELCKELKIKTV
jgi:hypothetical protein